VLGNTLAGSKPVVSTSRDDPVFIIFITFTKLQVSRDVIGGLSSKSKKWELVVGDT